MPEIAEVEIIRQGLNDLCGSKLKEVQVFDDKLSSFLASAPIGRRLTSTMRHGKRLGLVFDEEIVVSLHLRMTGSLLLEKDPRSRLNFIFGKGIISFVDPRRFGTVEVGDKEHFSDGLGLDLFALNPSTYSPILAQKLQRSTLPAKAVLLDQTRIAGIGNYLADEALWSASISPLSPAKNLEAKDWQKLLLAARRVARAALKAGGASFSDYRKADGTKGQMQTLLKAYGRGGQPCLFCGKNLIKVRVAGRGTTYCPDCQLQL
jgi:formamidopyrimidine-DNA glycosylase